MKRLLLLLLIPIALLLSLGGSAFASSTPSPPSPNATSFTVTPTRVVIPKGTTHYRLPVTLINSGFKPVTLTSSYAQLRQLPSGAAIPTHPMPGSGINWLSVSPTTVSLPSHFSRTTVYLTVNVPAHHTPGQKYLAVTWTAANQPTTTIKGNGAHIVPSLATPELIVNVTGKVISNPHTSLHAPSWSFGGHIPMTYKIDNSTSNVYALINKNTVTYNGKSVAAFDGQLVYAGNTITEHNAWASPPLGYPFKVMHLTGPHGIQTTIIRVPLVLDLITLAGLGGVVTLWIAHRRSIRKARAQR